MLNDRSWTLFSEADHHTADGLIREAVELLSRGRIWIVETRRGTTWGRIDRLEGEKEGGFVGHDEEAWEEANSIQVARLARNIGAAEAREIIRQIPPISAMLIAEAAGAPSSESKKAPQTARRL